MRRWGATIGYLPKLMTKVLDALTLCAQLRMPSVEAARRSRSTLLEVGDVRFEQSERDEVEGGKSCKYRCAGLMPRSEER